MPESDGDDTECTDPQEMLMRAVPELRNLPPGNQVCVIKEGERLLLYNVNRAHELTEGRTPTQMIDVAKLAERIHPAELGPTPEDGLQINLEHVKEVDLSFPVILLETLDELDGSPGGRLIDGHHRVYKAAQLGIAELPAIVVTSEEEPLIRITPGTGQSS